MAELQGRARSTAGPPLRVSSSASTLILKVPARPESISIVRLVLMSCGAAAGLSLREIFSCSQEAVDAFTDALIADPAATSIVIRAYPGVTDLDLVAVHGPSTESA